MRFEFSAATFIFKLLSTVSASGVHYQPNDVLALLPFQDEAHIRILMRKLTPKAFML